MPSPTQLALESLIATAHRNVFRAMETADLMQAQGVACDLESILRELERIQVSLLTSNSRRIAAARRRA